MFHEIRFPFICYIGLQLNFAIEHVQPEVFKTFETFAYILLQIKKNQFLHNNHKVTKLYHALSCFKACFKGF